MEIKRSSAASVDKTLISDKDVVTAVGSDYVLLGDTSDTDNLKKALISDFASAGGDMSAATYDPAAKAEQLLGISDIQITVGTPGSDSNIVSEQGIREAIDAIGDKTLKATYFATITSGTTTGQISKPAGGNATFIMDEWGTDTDALLSTIENGKPTYKSPVDSSGDPISTTFDVAGNYTFSGTPVPAAAHALIYVYTCKISDFLSSEALFESELIVTGVVMVADTPTRVTVNDGETIQAVIDACDTAVGNLREGFTNPYVVSVPPGHEKEFYSTVRNAADAVSDKKNVKVVFEDNPSNEYVIDSFDNCETTTDWAGLGTSTLTLDTTKNFEGTNCFKVTRSTTGDPGIQKTITPIDVRKYQGILVDIEFNATEIKDFTLLCYDNNMEFATVKLSYTSAFTGKLRTTVFLPFSFPTDFTTFDYSVVKILRFSFVRKTGFTGTCTGYMDNIRFIRTTPHRVAIVRFDDSKDEHFSIASKAMTAKGWRGSFCVTEPKKWGREAGLLTTEQVKSMNQIGHNIINHSLTGTSYVGMSRSESYQNVLCMRKALEHNGVTPALQLHMSPGYTGNEYILNCLKQHGIINMDGRYNFYPTFTVSISDPNFTISSELQKIINSGIGGITQIVIHEITNETNFNTRMDWIEENFSEIWLATGVVDKLPSKYKPTLIEGKNVGYQETLSSHFDLYEWHGQRVILDPGGSNRNIYPINDFNPYYGVEVINTADAAEILTFDPTFNAAGAHDGANNADTLTDSGEAWTIGQLVGRTVNNTTDVSSGIITANDGTTVTAILSGGTDNDWDTGDTYTITPEGLNQEVTQNERGIFAYDGSGWQKIFVGVGNVTHTGDVTGSTALTIASSVVDIAMHSATGVPSSANFLRGDNTWSTPSGSGDVSKVGTPVDNQVGVWTGDGTIEGTSGLTYDGVALGITGNITLSGTVDGIDIATDVAANTAKTGVTGEISNVVEDTSPQLGGTLEINEKAILIDAALASDHTWTGPTQLITAGENLAIFETAYLKSDGKYWRIDADAEATAKGKIVMATAAISADATGIVLLPGEFSFIRDDSTTKWTVTAAGDTMYLGLAVGELTNNISGYTAGDIGRVAGYMETATILNFIVDKTWIKI